MKTNLRGFSSLLSVIAVLVLGVLLLALYKLVLVPHQASSQTAFTEQKSSVNPYGGWILYMNEKFGYAVRYPSYWRLNDLSYVDSTGTSTGFRLYVGPYPIGPDGKDAVFDMFACRPKDGTFTSYCYEDSSTGQSTESITLDDPNGTSTQALDSFDVTMDYIHTIPYYTEALEVLRAATVPHGPFALADDDTYALAFRIAADGMNELYATVKANGREVVLARGADADTETLGGFVENGAYMALDRGTSAARGYAVYSLATGEKKAQICGVHALLLWRNFALYRSCHTDENLAGWEAGIPRLEAINLETGAITVLADNHVGDAYYMFYNLTLAGDAFKAEAQPLTLGPDGLYVQTEGSSEWKLFDLKTLLGT